MSILEELYYGNIELCEKHFKKGSEQQKLTHYIAECETEFLKSLNTEQKELYKNILDASFKRESLSDLETFIEGFKLGAKIILSLE